MFLKEGSKRYSWKFKKIVEGEKKYSWSADPIDLINLFWELWTLKWPKINFKCKF